AALGKFAAEFFLRIERISFFCLLLGGDAAVDNTLRHAVEGQQKELRTVPGHRLLFLRSLNDLRAYSNAPSWRVKKRQLRAEPRYTNLRCEAWSFGSGPDTSIACSTSRLGLAYWRRQCSTISFL